MSEERIWWIGGRGQLLPVEVVKGPRGWVSKDKELPLTPGWWSGHYIGVVYENFEDAKAACVLAALDALRREESNLAIAQNAYDNAKRRHENALNYDEQACLNLYLRKT